MNSCDATLAVGAERGAAPEDSVVYCLEHGEHTLHRSGKSTRAYVWGHVLRFPTKA